MCLLILNAQKFHFLVIYNTGIGTNLTLLLSTSPYPLNVKEKKNECYN